MAQLVLNDDFEGGGEGINDGAAGRRADGLPFVEQVLTAFYECDELFLVRSETLHDVGTDVASGGLPDGKSFDFFAVAGQYRFKDKIAKKTLQKAHSTEQRNAVFALTNLLDNGIITLVDGDEMVNVLGNAPRVGVGFLVELRGV